MGGREERAGGGGGAGESSCSTSQRAASTPARPSTSFHIFISHAYISTSPAPPSPLPVFIFPISLSSASPHPHFRCLTQHTFTPLCTIGHFVGEIAGPRYKKSEYDLCHAICLLILFFDYVLAQVFKSS